MFAALSRHGAGWSVDLSAAYGDTELRGNGASPVELLAIDRAQVFTHPDLTENTQTQVILEGSRTVSDAVQIAGNVFYRNIDTDTFNGDGTPFEECDIDDEEFLVEEDFVDLNGDGECSAADDDGIEQVLDLNGEPIEAELDDQELDAVNNHARRRAGKLRRLRPDWPAVACALGGDNNLTLGVAYERRTNLL